MLLYQLLMGLALPFVLLVLAFRKGEPAGGLGERLGFLAPPEGEGMRLWLHGASNGELTSARPVLDGVLRAQPGLKVLVTANTATGRAMVQAWGLPGVTAALAPLDAGGAAGRVLDRWQPQALVIVENELWPVRIAAAERRGVPVLVVGARISERSAKRWALASGLLAGALGRLRFLSAQDADSLQRLRKLGLPEGAVGPVVSIKAHAAAKPLVQPPFPPPAARAATLLAASTHEGEEAPVLEAFLAARSAGPFQFLILAPRHPRRGEEVAEVIRSKGLNFAQRSKGEVPDPHTQVFLADTLGEMDHWYAMAGACVIGGTFAEKGGHTPWEPALHGCALLHGPSLSNFAAPFAALDAAGAAIALPAGAGLVNALAGALRTLSATRQRELAQRASPLLRPEGEPEMLVRAILKAMKS